MYIRKIDTCLGKKEYGSIQGNAMLVEGRDMNHQSNRNLSLYA
jgi:hypothetical protein